jgi:pimeloyl-ACP methyl ester carboxylesterase
MSLLSWMVIVDTYFVPCPIELGGGLCPLGDTCCPITYHDDNTIGSACIPTVSGLYNGSCCFDPYTKLSTTSNNDRHSIVFKGCGVGYTCPKQHEQEQQTKTDDDTDDDVIVEHENESDHFCQATSNMTDPFLQRVLPYHLCYQGMGQYINVDNNESINDVFDLHGWPVGVGLAIIPYYSSHGDLLMSSSSSSALKETIGSHRRMDDVEYVVIGIHGALRNADDLYCSLLASTYQNTVHIKPQNILIVTIRFPITTDLDIYTTMTDSGEVIQWDESDGGLGGSWRLGMNAVWPPYATHFSSYDIMDQIIQHILSFRNLRHISVIGHSAGGQFVQRWSLLTPIWIENRMSSVVANPSSYAYLTNKRRLYNTIHGQFEWIIPNRTNCPNYNQWMWGLEPDISQKTKNVTTYTSYKLSYVQKAIHASNNSNVGDNVQYIKERFASRHIIYLAGRLDHCNETNTSQPHPWCISHGLQSTCSDMLQGSNRWERHWNYWKSLQRIYKTMNHPLRQYRDTVEHVGHDYSLIFNSNIGLKAIYNPYQYFSNNYVSTTDIDATQPEGGKEDTTNQIFNQKEVPIQFYIRERPFVYNP